MSTTIRNWIGNARIETHGAAAGRMGRACRDRPRPRDARGRALAAGRSARRIAAALRCRAARAFAATVMAQIPDRAKGRPIEIRFQNEAGSASSARWRDLGQAARAPHGRRYDWAYPFSAACPQRCDAAGPVMPANAEAMSVHLRTAARWRLAVTPPSSSMGRLLARSRSPKTLPSCVCPYYLCSSKTSGNICAATNSPSPPSTATTNIHDKNLRRRELLLSKNQRASQQSPSET